ncbi:MAG: hypothetical protein ICV84_01500, partial [Flavisolibacter sp.]|nr:hypothetical protein [Flavisolibacter sp.]
MSSRESTDLSSPTRGQGAMLRNYFKIAIRSLSRNKLFSFITIFGLALSMSVCMMVMLRVKDQLSYDRFHPKGERVYR